MVKLDTWCRVLKRKMERCITWVILTMMSIQMVMSYNITLSPESITTEVGTDSVNFTCRIQLELYEAFHNHWIIWWNGNTKIVDNDVVLINSAKYSVHGLSSSALPEYTQTLQVNDIKKTDHGQYICTLVFPLYPPDKTDITTSSVSMLIIRNFIPQPVCSIIPSESETGQQKVTLSCTSSPGDSPIILYWIDDKGNISALTQQQNQNETVTLLHRVSIESLSSSLRFTCKAIIAGSPENTKECIIGNLTSMTLAPTTSSTVSQKLSVTETVDEKVPTTSITVSPKLSVSETTNGRSTAIPTKTTNKAISHSPITLKITGITYTTKPTATEQNDITTSINVKTETSLPYDSTSNVTQDKSSSKNNTTIIIFAILAGVFLVVVFIAMLLLLRTHLITSENEEIHLKKCATEISVHSSSDIEYPEGETDIHNENQEHRLITIEFGDGQLGCAVYKNSIYETNTDDLDPFYAEVRQKNVEESQESAATDDPKKTKDIYPLEDNPEYISIEEAALKKASAPPIKAEKPKKLTVKNYPAPNGDMYAQVDRSSNSISDRLSTLLSNEEQESVRRKKSERKNDKLRDEKKENTGILKKSSRFIDNDDTYTIISEIAQNSDGEEETDEFIAAEDKEDDKHEDDNISRTSVGSSGSIHYEVDSNALYTKVLKPEKSTTD